MLSIPGLPLKLPRPLSAPLARLWPQARALACMPCCPWPVRCAVGRWNDECRNLWKRHQLKANSKLNVKAYRERRGIFFRVTLGNPSSRPQESALGGRRSAHFRIRYMLYLLCTREMTADPRARRTENAKPAHTQWERAETAFDPKG